MKGRYSDFVLSYLRWYNRMSTGPHEPKYNPCLSLSVLQTMNIFSLSLFVAKPAAAVPAWVFVLILFALGALIYRSNRKVFDSIDEIPKFARGLTDNVPGVREFPRVYGYLVLTLVLLFLPIWVG